MMGATCGAGIAYTYEALLVPVFSGFDVQFVQFYVFSFCIAISV